MGLMRKPQERLMSMASFASSFLVRQHYGTHSKVADGVLEHGLLLLLRLPYLRKRELRPVLLVELGLLLQLAL